MDSIVESASIAGGQSRTAKLTRGALEEGKQFLGIFLYLAVVFGMFVLHEWLVLSKENIGYRFYGIAFINALILALRFRRPGPGDRGSGGQKAQPWGPPTLPANIPIRHSGAMTADHRRHPPMGSCARWSLRS